MREHAFRAFAASALGEASADSYVSRLRRVERVARCEIDSVSLDPDGISALLATMRAERVNAAAVANCGSALRLYARFRGNGCPEEKRSAISDGPRSSVLRQSSVIDLLRLYGDVLDELRDRGVARTGNGPIGDYAERLFARAFGWTLTGNSTAGHDATSEGIRYQIKARRLARPGVSRQLGVLRGLDAQPFDVLAAVLFDARFGIGRAALIPFEVVRTRATWTAHVNGHRFLLVDHVWSMPGVRDVTVALAEAAVAMESDASCASGLAFDLPA